MKIPFLSKKTSSPAPEKAAAQPPKAVSLPPEKVPAVKLSQDPKKTYLFVGLICIVGAFVGVCAIFYMMTNEGLQKEEKIKNLNDQLVTVNAEKDIMEGELESLKAQADSIKIETIVAQSQKMYGQDESSRKEGLLWVDRKSKMYIVTLGALNGLEPGSTLSVFDGENRVGEVTVDLPLDVISYVQPTKRSSEKMTKNSYRVLIE